MVLDGLREGIERGGGGGGGGASFEVGDEWQQLEWTLQMVRGVERLRTLLPREIPLQAALGQLLEAADAPRLEFRPYDWASNDNEGV